jgi:oxalate decarboxylase
MTSRHATSLTNGEIVEENDLGSIRRVTADSLPILSGMSIKRIVLNPGAMRTPHWHANANELTYCVSGTSLVSVLDTYSKFSSFTVGAGEMFHIDSGSLHHIENIGEDAAEFILAFRGERPEDFGLAAAFGAMTDAVLGNTYDLPASDFAKVRRDTSDRRLAGRGRSGRAVDGTIRRSTQVRRRGAEPADRDRGRLCPAGPPAVLARTQGLVHVLAAHPRRRHA